mmetsp:Transcript_35170/g.92031  ORF Transcript_35170/g.92031 Transcript_35170/m.92031 type:complete len:251 (+) Transcript_35170:232-984(+)
MSVGAVSTPRLTSSYSFWVINDCLSSAAASRSLVTGGLSLCTISSTMPLRAKMRSVSPISPSSYSAIASKSRTDETLLSLASDADGRLPAAVGASSTSSRAASASATMRSMLAEPRPFSVVTATSPPWLGTRKTFTGTSCDMALGEADRRSSGMSRYADALSPRNSDACRAASSSHTCIETFETTSCNHTSRSARRRSRSGNRSFLGKGSVDRKSSGNLECLKPRFIDFQSARKSEYRLRTVHPSLAPRS